MSAPYKPNPDQKMTPPADQPTPKDAPAKPGDNDEKKSSFRQNSANWK